MELMEAMRAASVSDDLTCATLKTGEVVPLIYPGYGPEDIGKNASFVIGRFTSGYMILLAMWGPDDNSGK